MENLRHSILCVDDDTSILNALKRLLRKEEYRLFFANSTAEGLSLLEKENIHLILCDQRMPGMSGTEFLAIVREKYPDIIRIVLTGYTDVDTITESINKGHIYKFILKPWDDQNLRLEIRHGLEQYDLVQSNKMLHETIIRKNEELKTINENLEHMVRERTKDLEVQNQALELSRTILQELSVPVIGISSEMIIVFKNNKTRTLSDKSQNLLIGKDISEYFPEAATQKIEYVFKTGNGCSLENLPLFDTKYDIDIIPLTGKFEGKGIVMVLNQN